MKLFDVIVEHEYIAQSDDELTLQVGARIAVTSDEPNGWWEGELDGRAGVFPSNFVRKLEPGAAAPPPALSSSGQKRLVRATHGYDAQDIDELTIAKGDLITVLAEIDEGWWQGELKGRVGLFPSNFVKEEPAPVEDANKSKKAAPVTVSNTSPAANTGNKAAPVTASPAVVATVTTAKSDKPAYLFKVKAMHDYPAAESDELSLRKTDILLVTKNEDGGWWEGTNEATGKKGVFPSNFVEEIPNSSPSAANSKAGPAKPTTTLLPENVPTQTKLERSQSSNGSLQRPLQPVTTAPATVAEEAVTPDPTSVLPKLPVGGVSVGLKIPLGAVPQLKARPKVEDVAPVAADRPTELFERKKFAKAGQTNPVPASNDPSEDELASKMKFIGRRNDDSAVPSDPTYAAPFPAGSGPTAANKPAKPAPTQKPLVPPMTAKPAPAPVQTVTPPVQTVTPPTQTPAIAIDDEDDESLRANLDDAPMSPSLQHVTKSRPRVSTARRPPTNTRRLSSVPPLDPNIAKPNIPVVKPPPPAKTPTMLAVPPIASSGPTYSPPTASSGPTYSTPPTASPGSNYSAVPVKPNISKKSGPPSENATLADLRQWMISEVESLREELQEERQKRIALEQRLAQLEK